MNSLLSSFSRGIQQAISQRIYQKKIIHLLLHFLFAQKTLVYSMHGIDIVESTASDNFTENGSDSSARPAVRWRGEEEKKSRSIILQSLSTLLWYLYSNGENSDEWWKPHLCDSSTLLTRKSNRTSKTGHFKQIGNSTQRASIDLISSFHPISSFRLASAIFLTTE